MKKLIVGFFILNIFSISAFADFLIEPSLGYGIGSYTNDIVNPFPDVTGATSGISLGAKLGYSFAMVYGALDLSYSMVSLNPDSAGQADTDANQTNIGLTAGVDLAIVRAWLGYVFSSNISGDTTAANSDYKGSGFKIGAGYKIIPMVSLNAEYFMLSYDEIEPTSAFFTELTTNLFLLSVSVPLSI